MSDKKLCRVEEGKVLLGVCGGVAGYLDIDPTVRLGWCLAGMMYGVGVAAYVIAACVIPPESKDTGGDS